MLLDLDERDLPGVAYRVVEQMVVDELIDPEDRSTVMRSLLLRHRHVNDNNDRFRFGMRRNVSSYTSLQVRFNSIHFFSIGKLVKQTLLNDLSITI